MTEQSESGWAAVLGKALMEGLESGLNAVINCGKCHTCGADLHPLHWRHPMFCPECGVSRYYKSHGFIHDEDSPCPEEGDDDER